ncbi:MAG: exosortase A [Sedimenticola sp.]|nr:exosortase A [Sedimenticola sp.]
MNEKQVEALPHAEVLSKRWLVILSQLFALLITLLLIFHETAWSMVSIWYRSETFAHGFIILPITLWLIWEKRKVLSELTVSPEYRAITLLVVAGFMWLLGYLVSALVIQQLAFVGMLIISIWIILGNKITWYIAFPLIYLFFAVPMGEDLVPPLMEITATFTVSLIKLTGIPVFREGLYFSLPTGNWNVVEACSGVRYLIASITLGALYAYLTYRSFYKRTAFIIISAIVPILANSFRAYIIVMLGHMSDMKIATGVDHLIYGWLFFGLVMMILFWIGAKWRDPELDKGRSINQENDHFRTSEPHKRIVAAVFIVMIINGVWPLMAIAIESKKPVIPQEELTQFFNLEEWQILDKKIWNWQPMLLGADKRMDQYYKDGPNNVMVSVGQYIDQKQGSEMINSQNLLIDPENKTWRLTKNYKQDVLINGKLINIEESIIEGDNRKLLIWTWFRVGDIHTANNYIIKLYEGGLKLTLNKPPSAKVIFAVEIKDSKLEAEKVLQRFASESYPAVLHSLERLAEIIH